MRFSSHRIQFGLPHPCFIRRFSLALSIGLCVLASFSASSAWAQPATPDKAQLEQRDYDAFTKEVGKTQNTDPQAALDMLQKFAQDHPGLDSGVRVTLLSDAANLAFGKLHNKERALQIASQSLTEAKNVVANGGSDFLIARATLVKSNILMSSGQTDEAEALLASDESWQRYALLLDSPGAWARSYGTQAVGLLLSDYERSNRPGEAVTQIERLIKFSPSLLVTNRAGIIDSMANDLIKNNKTEEALGWAKLSYVLAAFETGQIDHAVKSLTRAWASNDDMASMRDFTRSQSGAADAKNPLAALAFPAIVTDKTTQEALSALAPQWEKAGTSRNHDLVGLYILTNQPRKAMEKAQAIWRDDPQGAPGVQEVGRVFKAVDLNTTRGNAFIAYLAGTADGPNPVKEFLKEHADDKATPVAP